MNTQNYASLEACQRLVDAGIVLKTEAYWIRVANSPMMLVDNRHGADEYYPAPSMVEVWRELPNTYSTDTDVRLKTLMSYQAGYKALKDDVGVWFSYDTNPTDALIDLLIWVRKEKP
jgi:hypothetical protein